jgi:DNA-binding beta-propeller fold protein YncE
MKKVIAYVVSGSALASQVTPVNTRTHVARPPIAIGGGAQSIVVTPNGKMVYVPNGVLNTVTPIRTSRVHQENQPEPPQARIRASRRLCET